MRKRFLILFLLCLPIAGFAQASQYKGSYRALSINFMTDDKFEADFEVGDDGTINGKFLLGEQKTPVENDLTGKVDEKGKFEAQAVQADGTIFGIKGVLPNASGRMTIKFSRKSVIASKGKKQVGEFELMGLIERKPNPVSVNVPAAAEMIFPDSGKTYLKIDFANSFFGNVWENMTVSSSLDTKIAGKTFRALELTTENGDTRRRLRFALTLEPDKTVWIAEKGKNWSVTYSESKGEEKKFFFLAESGSISIFKDNDTEIVWQINNLVMRNTRKTEQVKFSGYIHVRK